MTQKWQTINTLDGMFVRALNGLKALCTQSNDEINKKKGLLWAASRLIIAAVPSTGVMNSAGVYYSIISVGSLPVKLNRREFGRTGTSIVEDVFSGPTYTGGTPDPVYNMNGITPHVFEFQLLSSPTVTAEGTKFAPTVYAIGATSQQSKGASNSPLGEDYILAPNTDYLLKFYSTDTQNQDISVRIEGYEGELDIPNEDLL